MIHRFKKDAAKELLEAVEHYDAIRSDLAREFFDEIDQGIKSIKQTPQRWPTSSTIARRYRLDRFPYNIVYQAIDDVLVIVAVAHQHRKPGYWKKRLDEE